jgi:GrpB-like predicted nucleotidyltransferase (UPF0157 family)
MTNLVSIVPYDPEWPPRFDDERRTLAAAFSGSDATIEHIGSTAVPGLTAKPVIDILVGVPILADVGRHIPALETAGYEYVSEYEALLPERRYFRKPRSGRRLFHVHCVMTGSPLWIRHLAFRDWLRAHPASAAAYHDLKRELAGRLSKADYTEAKRPFIESILASALHREG